MQTWFQQLTSGEQAGVVMFLITVFGSVCTFFAAAYRLARKIDRSITKLHVTVDGIKESTAESKTDIRELRVSTDDNLQSVRKSIGDCFSAQREHERHDTERFEKITTLLTGRTA